MASRREKVTTRHISFGQQKSLAVGGRVVRIVTLVHGGNVGIYIVEDCIIVVIVGQDIVRYDSSKEKQPILKALIRHQMLQFPKNCTHGTTPTFVPLLLVGKRVRSFHAPPIELRGDEYFESGGVVRCLFVRHFDSLLHDAESVVDIDNGIAVTNVTLYLWAVSFRYDLAVRQRMDAFWIRCTVLENGGCATRVDLESNALDLCVFGLRFHCCCL